MRHHQINPTKFNKNKRVVKHLLPYYTNSMEKNIPFRKPETITSIDGHSAYEITNSGNIIKLS